MAETPSSRFIVGDSGAAGKPLVTKTRPGRLQLPPWHLLSNSLCLFRLREYHYVRHNKKK